MERIQSQTPLYSSTSLSAELSLSLLQQHSTQIGGKIVGKTLVEVEFVFLVDLRLEKENQDAVDFFYELQNEPCSLGVALPFYTVISFQTGVLELVSEGFRLASVCLV